MPRIWIILFAATLGQLAVAFTPAAGKRPLWNDTWTDILKRDLLMTYDKYSRPSQPADKTTVVASLNLLYSDMDEDKSAFVGYFWYSLKWNDPKLAWNPADYGNMTTLHISDHEIWQPDITLYNSAIGSGIDIFSSTNCIAYSNGSVLWVPPATMRSYCEMDMRNWPFDEHNCTLVFGSWTYNALQVDLIDDEFSLANYQQNNKWTIKATNQKRMVKHYDCCVEPYVSLEYSIVIQRRSPMYRAVVVAPAFIVILMALASFWLPAQSGEKILLNGVNVLIVVSLLVFFAQRIPVFSSNTPLIVLFYSSSLYLLGFSMLLSVIVIQISKNKHSRPVPWYIKNQLDGTFGTLLGLTRLGFQTNQMPRAEELRDHNQTSFEDHNSGHEDQHIINNGQSPIHKSGPVQQYWIMLATAIDRIAFCFYCIFFFVLAVAYAI